MYLSKHIEFNSRVNLNVCTFKNIMEQGGWGVPGWDADWEKLCYKCMGSLPEGRGREGAGLSSSGDE